MNEYEKYFHRPEALTPILYFLLFLLENWIKIGSTTLKEWITTDCRNTPSTTNPEDEEIVDAPGKDGNASMPEQVKRPNPWRKMMMMTTFHTLHIDILLFFFNFQPTTQYFNFAPIYMQKT